MKKQVILVLLITLALSTSAFSMKSSKGNGHVQHGNGNGVGHSDHGNGNGYGHNNGGGGTPEPATILLIAGGIAAAFGAKKIKDL